MNKEKIAKIIYEELSYMYCDNCRYAFEIGEDDPTWNCDECYRKYNSWGISMAKAEQIAEMIGGIDVANEDGTLTVRVSDGSKVKRVLVLGDNHCGGLYYADDDDDNWIPLNDDSAVPNHEVICQDRHGNMMLGYAWVDEYGIWVCEDDNIMMDDVVAWRPKPKPYKGGDTE